MNVPMCGSGPAVLASFLRWQAVSCESVARHVCVWMDPQLFMLCLRDRRGGVRHCGRRGVSITSVALAPSVLLLAAGERRIMRWLRSSCAATPIQVQVHHSMAFEGAPMRSFRCASDSWPCLAPWPGESPFRAICAIDRRSDFARSRPLTGRIKISKRRRWPLALMPSGQGSLREHVCSAWELFRERDLVVECG